MPTSATLSSPLVTTPGAGDPLRKWRKLKDGTSLWWHVQSRNKHSLTLDLRQPEGQLGAADAARQG